MSPPSSISHQPETNTLYVSVGPLAMAGRRSLPDGGLTVNGPARSNIDTRGEVPWHELCTGGGQRGGQGDNGTQVRGRMGMDEPDYSVMLPSFPQRVLNFFRHRTRKATKDSKLSLNPFRYQNVSQYISLSYWVFSY